MEFEILEQERGLEVRRKFIEKFVDTSTEYYKKYIAKLTEYNDGNFYSGYLWACINDNKNYEKECCMEVAVEYLRSKENVLVMWDLFSNERIRDGRKFSLNYPKDTVIKIDSATLADKLEQEWDTDGLIGDDDWFPEDIYCFDENMDWYVIFTHEGWDSYTNPELREDDYIRICFLQKTESLTFGHAGKEDKAAILTLYRAVIGVPGSTWTYEYPNEEYLEGDFARGDLFCLKNESGEVVGAISVDADELVDKLGCWSKELEPAIEIARLVVREDYRNKGLARLLIKNMMDEARKRGARSVHYLVSKKNERALRSYAKLRFNRVGECDLYDGDWWCYEKEL